MLLCQSTEKNLYDASMIRLAANQIENERKSTKMIFKRLENLTTAGRIHWIRSITEYELTQLLELLEFNTEYELTQSQNNSRNSFFYWSKLRY